MGDNPLATVLNYMEHFVPEEFSRDVQESINAVDPAFLMIQDEYEGVSHDEVSDEWRVIHTYTTGVAGAVRFRSALGATTGLSNQSGWKSGWGGHLIGDYSGSDWAANAGKFIPAGDVTHAGDLQRAVQLIQCDGNMALPHHILRADNLSAAIARKVVQTISGVAKNLSQTMANAFYAQESNSSTTSKLSVIADLGTVGTDPVSGAGTVSSPYVVTIATINANTNGFARIRALMPSMLVDVRTTAGLRVNSEAPLMVTKVDYIGGTFEMVSLDNSDPSWSRTTNDVICPRLGSTAYGSADTTTAGSTPYGPNHWLKDSGTLFDTIPLTSAALSLTEYPWYKSLVNTTSGYLSGNYLDQFLGAFWEAYGGLYVLDTMLTTAGVLNGYITNIENLFSYERSSGGVLKLEEGWVFHEYTYQGRPLRIYISPYQATGKAWLMELGNQNLTRYVAPPLPGAGHESNVPRVEFPAKSMGYNSIWSWAVAGDGAKTDWVEAPFLYVYNHAPKRLPGGVINGLSESIL